MNIYEVPKNQNCTFLIGLVVFKIFLHASMKSLIYCEDPSSKPLQGACSGSPIAACDTKRFFKNRL
jgi:hypothetical protein